METPRANETLVLVRKAIKPIRDELMGKIDAIDEKQSGAIVRLADMITKNAPEALDKKDLVQTIADMIKETLTVEVTTESITKNNNVVAKVDLPEEIGSLIIGVLSLVEALKKDYRLDDFRPHNQEEPAEKIGYYGYVHPSGAWYIQYVNTDDKTGEQKYAFGLSGYAAAWDKHRTLKYKNINEVMSDAL